MTAVPPSVPPSAPPAAPAKTGRGLRLLLAVSLALNLAVVGAVVGIGLRSQDEGRPMVSAVRDLNFGPFTEALTREQRRSLLRSFSEQGPGLRDLRAQMRGDFDAVLAALRAQPFDAAAFRLALQTQGERMAARADTGREALVGLIVGMTPEERAIFLQRLEQTLAKHGGRRGGDDAQKRGDKEGGDKEGGDREGSE